MQLTIAAGQGRVGELNRRNADLLDQLTRLQAILETSGIAQAKPARALSRDGSGISQHSESVYEDARYGHAAPPRQESLHSVMEGGDDDDEVGCNVE